VEEVRLVDKFSPPGGGRSSACYRITFRFNYCNSHPVQSTLNPESFLSQVNGAVADQR
jgi:hypothetical protein